MDEYPLNHLLGLPYAVLQRIVWHLRAPAAGALANCIRDPTMRATVQSAPARVTDVFWFKHASWQLPSPRWIVPGGRNALTAVNGNNHFLLFWRQLDGDDFAAAVAEDVAPWLELSVHDCDAIGVEHLERLGRICRKLHLDNCPKVSRVDLLGRVPMLALYRCGRVTDLTGLGAQGQVSVHLWGLKITSLQPAGRVPVLSVTDCPLVLDLEGLGGPGQVEVTLSKLKITSLGPVGSLKGIKSLTLNELPMIENLLGLTGVKAAVNVLSCPNVRSAEGLQGCKWVHLLQLQQLCDVGMLGAVPWVNITSCPKVLELWRSERGQCVGLADMAQVENLDLLALATSIKID
jgi:hypothetical protein